MECPTVWIRLLRNRRAKRWDNIEDPSKRNLYGHPLAGLLWERRWEEVLLQLDKVKVLSWECLYVHRQTHFLSVYVDDIKLAFCTGPGALDPTCGSTTWEKKAERVMKTTARTETTLQVSRLTLNGTCVQVTRMCKYCNNSKHHAGGRNRTKTQLGSQWVKLKKKGDFENPSSLIEQVYQG